jgi:uncharacterized delta-60 repeat protein
MKNSIKFLLALLFASTVLLAQPVPGALDITFGNGGKTTGTFDNVNANISSGAATALQSDGKIIVAGQVSFSASNNFCGIARYNANGSIDASFGNGGRVSTDVNTKHYSELKAVAIQADGKIVVAGNTTNLLGTNLDFTVIRYKTNGNLDSTFGTNGVVTLDFGNSDDFARSIAIQNDGKIIVGGDAKVSGNVDFAAARLNTNGTLDNGFGLNGKINIDFESNYDQADAMLLQPDGKILLGGFYTVSTNTHFAFGLVRLTSAGVLDANFGTNGKAKLDFSNSNHAIHALALQTDGRIVAAGEGPANLYVVTLNANGTYDTNFGNFGIFNNPSTHRSKALLIQPNGQIIVGGIKYNGSNDDFYLNRLESNGAVDVTFGSSGEVATDFNGKYDGLYGMFFQPNGKIVAVGKADQSTGLLLDFALARYETGMREPVTLVSPANNSTNVALPITLSWTAAPGINTYQIQVSTTADFSALVIDSLNNFLTINTALVKNTTYYWRVRTTNGANNLSFWSPVWTFKTLDVPSTFTLISPSNNASNVSLTPSFSWNNASLAAKYELQVSTSNTFATPVVSQPTLSVSNYTVATPLNINTVYYWRARASNSAGNGAWSSIWSFTTLAPAATPTLLSPANATSNISLTPAFDWNDAANATGYELQVSTTNTFASTIISQTALTASNYTTSTALANSTVYYWRVRAKNALGNSAWSTVWSFTTIPVAPPAPSVPTLLIPADAASNVSTTPSFDWNDASATNTYHIQVSTSNTFATLVMNDSTSTLSNFTPSSALSANSTYFWRVRAKGTGGTSAWSNVWSFKTENPNSLEDYASSIVVKVYPNPFSDFIQIETEDENVIATLFDMQGRAILQEIFSNTTKISTHELPTGVYVLKLQTNNSNISKQMIKTR